MSGASKYLKNAISMVTSLEETKPHSSITDWVEVLSSDRYDETSLDGIPELVDSINIQGPQGTAEAARAIRKKLKYGNVHRQVRALTILRALTENCGKGFQLNWANEQLMERLKFMATDPLTDSQVKKRLLLVFHAWSLHYKDEPRMQGVAGLYKKYSGYGRHVSHTKTASETKTSNRANSRTFDGDIFSHDWNPAPSQRGPDTYTDLAAAKADAEERKRAREARINFEQREAELERRERELKRKKEMAEIETRRVREAEEEAERKRKVKEQSKRKRASQPKRPPFNFEKEKPQIMVAVANAIQCANNLVNACRLVNREVENVTESPKVQDNLDKAKAIRKSIVRYIQLVTDEEFVGTLIDANEKIVEAILLYDRLSKPAVLDSDSETDEAADVAAMSKRLAAQKLEADRTGELQQMQADQKRESERRQQWQLSRQASAHGTPSREQSAQLRLSTEGVYGDLQDIDFGGSISNAQAAKLPPPIKPDSEDSDSYGGSLSDFSDYDSSDAEWQATHGPQAVAYKRQQAHTGREKTSTSEYATLEDDHNNKGLLEEDENPFGDPFADEQDTPVQEKQRLQCEFDVGAEHPHELLRDVRG
nr:hypothetical protein L203_01020 [Cryptococcus depauperatus CBS 7841]